MGCRDRANGNGVDAGKENPTSGTHSPKTGVRGRRAVGFTTRPFSGGMVGRF
jgi:hypothetical protein